MDIRCTQCDTAIEDSHINRRREIATCGSCGHLFDVHNLLSAAGEGAAAHPREPVPLPPGMKIEHRDGGKSLTITRRWLRGKHFLFLIAIVGLTVFLVNLWSKGNTGAPLVIESASRNATRLSASAFENLSGSINGSRCGFFMPPWL